MTSARKNNCLFGAVVLAMVIALGAVFLVNEAKASPSSIAVQTSANATTTVAYIGNGTATSTYQFDNTSFSSGKVPTMTAIDASYLYVQVAASSTATVLTVTPQVSNNGIDWYGIGSEGTASAAGAIAVSTTTSFTWTPGTTATTSMEFKLPDVATVHERIVFSMTGGAGAIYNEVVLKQNPSTP